MIHSLCNRRNKPFYNINEIISLPSKKLSTDLLPTSNKFQTHSMTRSSWTNEGHTRFGPTPSLQAHLVPLSLHSSYSRFLEKAKHFPTLGLLRWEFPLPAVFCSQILPWFTLYFLYYWSLSKMSVLQRLSLTTQSKVTPPPISLTLHYLLLHYIYRYP